MILRAWLVVLCAVVPSMAWAVGGTLPGYTLVTSPDSIAASLTWSADPLQTYSKCAGAGGDGVLSAHALPNSQDCLNNWVNTGGQYSGVGWSPDGATYGFYGYTGIATLMSGTDADAALAAAGGASAPAPAASSALVSIADVQTVSWAVIEIVLSVAALMFMGRVVHGWDFGGHGDA